MAGVFAVLAVGAACALPDVESMATLNSLSSIMETVRDLEQARKEREERMTLWPLADDPVEDDNAVLLGHMREMMTWNSEN